jgi:hypothetical protein
MAIVSVSGACSRSGKTALAGTLLAALPGAAAVKFTTTDDVFERCPRGTACVVCDIDVPFRIVEDAATLRRPGTDTARLLDAGARRVVWAIAKQSAVAPAWAAVRSAVSGERVLVMEGSTIVAEARPDLLLFAVHPLLSPSRWKPTTAALAARADLVVVNVPASEARPPSGEVMDALRATGASRRVRVADVTRPLAEWAPEMAARLAAVAAAAPAGVIA